jgi:hypothetical protein
MTSALDMAARSLRDTWRNRAACRGTDPELWFPASSSGAVYDRQVTAAKAICSNCPVRAECLSEALVRIPVGIAGGLTEDERRSIRQGGSGAAS